MFETLQPTPKTTFTDGLVETGNRLREVRGGRWASSPALSYNVTLMLCCTNMRGDSSRVWITVALYLEDGESDTCPRCRRAGFNDQNGWHYPLDRAVQGTGDGFVSNEAGMVDFNVSRQVTTIRRCVRSRVRRIECVGLPKGQRRDGMKSRLIRRGRRPKPQAQPCAHCAPGSMIDARGCRACHQPLTTEIAAEG